MSGIDEQPPFYVCPECVSIHDVNRYWTFGINDGHGILKELIWFDKDMNREICAVEDRLILTHVELSYAARNKELDVKEQFYAYISKINEVKCPNGHRFNAKDLEFDHVLRSVLASFTTHGAKYE